MASPIMVDSEIIIAKIVETKMFETTWGHKLACVYWTDKAVTSPKALVFICHGVAEHCRRYGNVVELLNAAGCYVFSHDHVGHGESEGERVFIEDFKQYVDDLFEHIDEVKKRFQDDTKLFIIAHSMGGAVAVLAAMRRPEYFSGLVLIAAALEFPDNITPCMQTMVILASKLFPHLQLPARDNSESSRDPAVVQWSLEDPLIWQGGVKMKWTACMIDAMNKIRPCVPEITWPFLVMHGTADTIVAIKGSRNLYRKAASQDKTLNEYKGYYHQLQLEPEPDRTEVCVDIRDWIVARLQ